MSSTVLHSSGAHRLPCSALHSSGEDNALPPLSELSSLLETSLRQLQTDNYTLDDHNAVSDAQMSLQLLQNSLATERFHNAQLERDLGDLDERIESLVKNKITLDIQVSKRTRSNTIDASDHQVLGALTPTYTELLAALHVEPMAVAALAKVTPKQQQHSILQILLRGVFGDEEDPHAQARLYTACQAVLQCDMQEQDDLTTVLRANSFVSALLTGVLKRQSCREFLLSKLSDVVSRVCESENDVELNDKLVYSSLFLGSNGSGDSDPSQETLDSHHGLQEELAKRRKIIANFTSDIVQGVIADVQALPEGVRVLCGTIASAVRDRFPNSTDDDVASLVGGFVFLRWITPAVATPTSTGLSVNAPTSFGKRALILVGKCLQAISNGVLFGAKESFMAGMNEFIHPMISPVKEFLLQLAVTDVSTAAGGHHSMPNWGYECPVYCQDLIALHSILADATDNQRAFKILQDTRVGKICKQLSGPPELSSNHKHDQVFIKLGASLRHMFAPLLSGTSLQLPDNKPASSLLANSSSIGQAFVSPRDPSRDHSVFMSYNACRSKVTELLRRIACVQDPPLSAKLLQALLDCDDQQSEKEGSGEDTLEYLRWGALGSLLRFCEGQQDDQGPLKPLAVQVLGQLSWLASHGAFYTTGDTNYNGAVVGACVIKDACEYIITLPSIVNKVKQQQSMIQRAIDQANSERLDIEERLDSYNNYLANIRQSALQAQPAHSNKQLHLRKQMAAARKEHKYTYAQMKAKAIIVHAGMSEATLNKMKFKFRVTKKAHENDHVVTDLSEAGQGLPGTSQAGPSDTPVAGSSRLGDGSDEDIYSDFELLFKAKGAVVFRLPLIMEDLLEKKSKGQTELVLEAYDMRLSIVKLVSLLNHKYLARGVQIKPLDPRQAQQLLSTTGSLSTATESNYSNDPSDFTSASDRRLSLDDESATPL